MGDGCVVIINRQASITDSQLYLLDRGRLELNSTSLDLTGASALFSSEHSSQLWLHTGSLFTIDAGVTFSNTYDPARSTQVHLLVEDSTLKVANTLVITGDAVTNFSSSTLLVQAGTLDLAGNSILS